MASKDDGSLFDFVDLFGKSLPGTPVLVLVLLLISIVSGVASVALMHYNLVVTDFRYALVGGSLAGILVVMLPALLTTLFIKAIKRAINLKHVVFIAIISSLCYSVFIMGGSLVYIATHNYTLSSAIILAGDASIFGWWFFVGKFVLAQKKRAALVALVHPTLNILFYIQAQALLFTFASPFHILLIKLYAGIFVFLLISYIIMFMFEKPVKKSLGISSIDTFVQMLQNWLFDININVPISNPIMGGTKTDIWTQTLILKSQSGRIKTIFFIPDLHYGPAGTLGSSNFPFLLERYSMAKYKAPTFVMHSAVNEDNNAISSSQFGQIAAVLDRGIAEAKSARNGGPALSYLYSFYKDSRVRILSFGKVGIVTLTRAPKVTEDIAPPVSTVFRNLLRRVVEDPIIIDAHNSRYESASKEELAGVTLNSVFMNNYISAMEKVGAARRRSNRILMGSASVEVYNALGRPVDLAAGNLNVAVFEFKGFRHAMLQFNANNMLPSFGREIKRQIKEKYGIDAEVYTTDTHFVNSLNRSADNVLGRHVSEEKVMPLVCKAIESAIKNIEPATAHYSKIPMKHFAVWGNNSREKIMAVMDSVIYMAKILVPLIIIAGFVIAGWIISVI
jgi:predicted neutral ceramidase superfamily lipid hydrolase